MRDYWGKLLQQVRTLTTNSLLMLYNRDNKEIPLDLDGKDRNRDSFIELNDDEWLATEDEKERT